jgi:light-regulated signal transduction histidine kinase (bacteriophytochrome)
MNNNKPKSFDILLFEDNPGDAGLLEEMLEEFNNLYSLKNVESLEEGLNALKNTHFDIILLDLGLPDSDGIDTLIEVNKKTPNIPIIVLTGLNSEEIGILAVKMGAQDYLIKREIDSKLLTRSINYSIERNKIEIELQKSQENLEEKVVERTKALEQSNKELKQFAYIASHDLKEPLRMITSFLQLLERRYGDKLDQDANEFIDFAVEGAKRLNEMIDDLLEFSKVTRKDIECSSVDINRVLEQTKMYLKLAIDDNKAEINYNTLPIIYGDEMLMVLLFQNIIGNSIKYRSEEIPKIDISVTKQSDNYLFAIKDNGIGMSPEHLQRIFTIFQRLHTKDEYEGTGIGLAIAQKIVIQHGGKIWAESGLEKGTTFYFIIPIKEGE